mgnify:CR=1 FL=1
MTHDVPVLCGTFLGTCDRACVGLLDGSARVVCLRSGTTTTLGAHAGGPAATIAHDEGGTGYVVTCGWDKTIRVWDPSAGAGDGREVSTTTTTGKCFASDCAEGRFVCATSDGQTLAYDVEDLARGGRPTVSRRSSMRFQTRAIAWNATRDGFVAASAEGRCAVEFARADEDASRLTSKTLRRKTRRLDTFRRESVLIPFAAFFFSAPNVVVAGGVGDDGWLVKERVYFDDAHVLDSDNARWRRLAFGDEGGTGPSARAYHTLTRVSESKCLCFGGFNGVDACNDAWWLVFCLLYTSDAADE